MQKNDAKNDKKVMLSRRGFVKHFENPSVAVAAESQLVTHKPVVIGSADNCLIKSGDTTINVPAGFYRKKPVDQTEFIKLYVDGLKSTIGLSKPGQKVFEIVYAEISGRPMKRPNDDDLLMLHYDMFDLDMSRATFDRGITELLKKEILYESMSTNAYFVNINMIFNGDRLFFINEFYLQKAPEWIEQDLPLD